VEVSGERALFLSCAHGSREQKQRICGAVGVQDCFLVCLDIGRMRVSGSEIQTGGETRQEASQRERLVRYDMAGS